MVSQCCGIADLNFIGEKLKMVSDKVSESEKFKKFQTTHEYSITERWQRYSDCLPSRSRSFFSFSFPSVDPNSAICATSLSRKSSKIKGSTAYPTNPLNITIFRNLYVKTEMPIFHPLQKMIRLMNAPIFYLNYFLQKTTLLKH
jgi:hypothetical protein